MSLRLQLSPAVADETADGSTVQEKYDAGRLLLGMVTVGVGYYVLAKTGSAVTFPGEVQAIWWPVGWAAGFLYLGGLRYWPGVVVADFGLGVIPGDPLFLNVAQTIGNTAEVFIAALLALRLLGPRSQLHRPEDVGRLVLAVTAGTALSATLGVASLLVHGDIGAADLVLTWRTWFAGDTCGGLLLMPLLMVSSTVPVSHLWAQHRRARTLEAVALIVAVAGTSLIGFAGSHPLTYVVFPSLIWAALRFGLRGATVATALAAGLAVGLTAHHRGPFVVSSIDDTVLSVQLYVLTATITTLILGAVVTARWDAAVELARAQQGEAEQAALARQRIARDLHDSVSQTLFSLTLQAGAAEHLLSTSDRSRPLTDAVREVSRLAHGALAELRALIFELRPEALVEEGLVAALAKHGAALSVQRDVTITVEGPADHLPLTAAAEEHLYRLAQEALGNALAHSGALAVALTVSVTDGQVRLTIRDDGSGFDPVAEYAGHLGLRTMRDRMLDLGGTCRIDSSLGGGTQVEAIVPATGRDVRVAG